MPHPQNLITDVPGLKVGHAHDPDAFTGVTVLLPDAPAIAAIDVRGGGPGTRESDALGLSGTVDHIHGLVLSGGSAFGLSAATAVQSWLSAQGRGFDVGGVKIPIVPQAILFDMLNGGDKDWGAVPPFEGLAFKACETAANTCDLGNVGAGFGATTATLRGGLGSASAHYRDGVWVGALAAVNAVGSATFDNAGRFWAGPFEIGDEFGGLGPPPAWPDPSQPAALKGGTGENTTLGVIATNAPLSKVQAHRLAVMAQTGLAKALHPVHTPLDGDVVFALSTAKDAALSASPLSHQTLAKLGDVAAKTMARAVARGIYHAAPAPQGWAGPPAWCTAFGASA